MTKHTIEQITLFKKPEESIGYLLWRVSIAWRTRIEKTLKVYDLTHPQFVVLATTAWLTKGGKHISQIDISRHTGLDPNTTSQVLRSLEAKHFIERVRSMNERNKNPTVTDAGHTVLKKALPAVERADVSFFSSLDSHDRASLVAIFQRCMHDDNTLSSLCL